METNSEKCGPGRYKSLMRLFVARHGQTSWNVEMLAQGHSDIPLDERGRNQAAQLAEALVGSGIPRIVSSDLSRAADTAKEIAATTGAHLTMDARLRERSLGDFEGRPFTEVQAYIRDEAARLNIPLWEVRPPNGESVADVFERIHPVAEWLFNENEDTLIMGHGAVPHRSGRI